MTSNDEARPLAAIIGERLRQFRDAKGLRQEDVADAAREQGFGWARSSVASIEAGTRDLSIAEVIMLPVIIRRLGGWDEPLVPPSEAIRLNDSVVLPPYTLQRFLAGLFAPTALPATFAAEPEEDEVLYLGSIEVAPGPTEEENRRYVARRVEIYDYILLKLWPDFERDRSAEMRAYASGLEILTTIASRLVTPLGRPDRSLVEAFSLGLWGRLPGQERDARVDESRFPTKRALQSARGHATRAMIEELQGAIDERWSEVQEAFDELDSVIDDPEKLEEWVMKLRYLENPDLAEFAEHMPPRSKKFWKR